MKISKPALLALAASHLVPCNLLAQATWTGIGSAETPALWGDSANWSGTPPANGSTFSLTFLNSAANSISSNNLTGLTITSLTVPANDGGTPTAVNIKDNNVSGNAITLSGDFTVSTGNWQTFNLPITLSGNRTFAINSGVTFIRGDLSGTAAIVKTGGGELLLSGNNSFAGGNVTSTGDERLAINSSSTVTLESAAAIGNAGGWVRFANNLNGVLSIRNDSAINDCNITGGSSGSAASITLGRKIAGVGFTQAFPVLNVGSRTCNFNQGGNVTSGQMLAAIGEIKMSAGNNDRPVTLAGSAAISASSAGIITNNSIRRLQLDGTSASNTLGLISNNSPGFSGSTLNLIKANSSTWTLTSANTYTGTTEINGGVLQLGSGGTTGAISPSSAITNNSTLAFNRSDTLTQGTDFAPVVSGTGSFRKSGAGNLILSGENLTTGVTRDVLTFSGANSGTVTLTHTAALGAPGNVIRFSGGGSGTLDLQTDTSMNAYGIASGAFNGGTLVANRATSGPTISHALGTLDLSSVTLTVNVGSNVTGSAAVSFTELKMNGGNDNNPVTLAGDADITIGSASITANGLAKRLRLDGTSTNNLVTGVISDTTNATTGAKVHLIKSNSGTWHLKGNNTYSGDTTVSEGRLKLDFPCLDDMAALNVDGVLELNHAGVDVVGSLTLGGVTKDPGEYDSSNSDGHIEGSGRIKVLAPDAFGSWASQNITAIDPNADPAATGDPDADGVSNLAEFAFNGNPLSGSDNGSIHAFTADSADAGSDKELVLTLAVRKEIPAAPAFSGTPLELNVAGITYTIEGSADLSTFSAAVTEVSPITVGLPDLSTNPDYEYRSFSLVGSNGLAGKGFLRAKVRN